MNVINTKVWDLTNAEVLKNWENKAIVWSIEMGGLGPGYEQALQEAIFNLFGYLHKHKINIKELVTDGKYNKKYDKIAHKVLDNMGLSGAQAGAAKSVALQFHDFGYKHMMDKAKKQVDGHRLIMVSKTK